jgi:hypothetical protein
VQDSPARNTLLLLAVKLGGPAGLALATLLLQQRGNSQGNEAAACAGAGDTLLQDRCSIDASNAAGETALSLAAAAALAGSVPAGKAAPAPGASKAAAAAAAAAAARSSADVAQQMLSVVLLGQPAVPEQLGATLLEAGLSGKLPDAIAAQVISAMIMKFFRGYFANRCAVFAVLLLWPQAHMLLVDCCSVYFCKLYRQHPMASMLSTNHDVLDGHA